MNAGIPATGAAKSASRLQTILVIAVTVVVIAAAAILVGGGAPETVVASGPTEGGTPAAFTATTYDGKTVSLADYAGKPLWLTIGASWCPDCRVEAPDVEAAYEANKAKGLNLLAVFTGEGASDIASYAGKTGLTFPIAVDEQQSIRELYRAWGIPSHYFIGADGKIKKVWIGALTSDQMNSFIADILK